MKKLFIFLIGFLSGFCGRLMAWNKDAHMLTGAIAYITLKKDNPAALKNAIRILKAQPAFQKPVVDYYYFAKPKNGKPKIKPGKTWAEYLDAIPNADDRDMALFMLAARWADDVRSYPYGDSLLFYYPKEEHRDEWHYINYPYVYPTHTDSVTPQKEKANNILEGLKRTEAMAKTGADSSRAIALCWVMHLFGDIHQPMHSVALFAPRKKLDDGDRGGNDLHVIQTKNGQTRKFSLHAYWDDNYIDTKSFTVVRDSAQAMMARATFQKDRFPQLKTNTQPADWAKKETLVQAIQYGYTNGTLGLETESEQAVLLTDEYQQNATRVQGEQIMLAGLRMAEWLGGL